MGEEVFTVALNQLQSKYMLGQDNHWQQFDTICNLILTFVGMQIKGLSSSIAIILQQVGTYRTAVEYLYIMIKYSFRMLHQ